MQLPTNLTGIRRLSMIFPPAGAVALWLSPEIGWLKKILGTLWIVFFGFLYCVLLIALVLWGLVARNYLKVEWRGGWGPSFTSAPTLPNYVALEAHRAATARAGTNQAAVPISPPYWTGFRGPLRDGHYQERPILTNWPAGGPKRLWSQPVGGGYASFAVANGLAYTIEQRRTNEVITAYDLNTGREVWAHAYYALFAESMGGDGPRATPAYYDGHIYSLGGLGQLKCLNATNGTALWTTNILLNSHADLPMYGYSGSPLVVEDKVIVAPGGRGGASVMAYDRLTSKVLWQSLNDEAAYSSPMLVELAGRRQILVVTATRAVGLRVEDGEPLWDFPWVVKMDNRNIAQPVLVETNRVFLSAGYTTGCAVIEIQPEGGKLAARPVWQNKNLKNKFSSSVFWQGHLYGLDEDILACVDAKTGERKWKDGRYGYGQLLLASGHLVILSGSGELALVPASPAQHTELARFQAITGKTWNYPAIAHSRLLVRNAAEMACFDLGGGQ